MPEVRGKGIARLYQTGGAKLLAHRLSFIFTKIEKGDDVARVRHNDMVSDVLDIINTTYPATDGQTTKANNAMLAFIARLLTERRIRLAKRKNRFLLALGGWILHIGQAKG